MKKSVLFLCACLLVSQLQAAQLIEEAQGVKDMLPGGAQEKKVTVTAAQQKEINAKNPEKLFAGELKDKTYRIFTGAEGNAIIENMEGKWGDIGLIVLVSPAGKVLNLEVLASSEKRGRPIVMRTFLDQYKGKSGSDPLKVGKDIDGVTGATISSVSVTQMVKRAIAVSALLGAEKQGKTPDKKGKTAKKK
jgi:Na+-translocating ferredoxin:NAD+ oxidoreductase RnfG subunit